jgi:hypothetical protein
MGKNIKISEEQYKMLQEASEDVFSYVTDSDFKPFDGQSSITADGKIDGETPSDNRLTGDKVAQMRTIDGWNRYRTYGGAHATTMRESDEKNDFYDMKGFENKQLNTLTNGNDKDNLTKIPFSVEQKLNILLDSIKKSNLNARQQGIILNKVIETLDYDSIPNQWKKELINDLK